MGPSLTIPSKDIKRILATIRIFHCNNSVFRLSFDGYLNTFRKTQIKAFAKA